MKIIKILSLVLALLMLCTAFAACNSNNSDNTNNNSNNNSNNSNNNSNNNANDGPKEKITLTVWGSQEDQEMLKEMCQAYAEANPDKEYKFLFGVQGEGDERQHEADHAEDAEALLEKDGCPQHRNQHRKAG